MLKLLLKNQIYERAIEHFFRKLFENMHVLDISNRKYDFDKLRVKWNQVVTVSNTTFTPMPNNNIIPMIQCLEEQSRYNKTEHTDHLIDGFNIQYFALPLIRVIYGYDYLKIGSYNPSFQFSAPYREIYRNLSSMCSDDPGMEIFQSILSEIVSRAHETGINGMIFKSDKNDISIYF